MPPPQDVPLVPTNLRMGPGIVGLPNVGKYNYRIVREEFMRMATSICPEPLDTLGTFGTLAELSGDI